MSNANNWQFTWRTLVVFLLILADPTKMMTRDTLSNLGFTNHQSFSKIKLDTRALQCCYSWCSSMSSVHQAYYQACILSILSSFSNLLWSRVPCILIWFILDLVYIFLHLIFEPLNMECGEGPIKAHDWVGQNPVFDLPKRRCILN